MFLWKQSQANHLGMGAVDAAQSTPAHKGSYSQ